MSIRPDIVNTHATQVAREIIGGATVIDQKAIGFPGDREFTVYGPELARHFIITGEVLKLPAGREMVDTAVRQAAREVQRHSIDAFALDELIEERIDRELSSLLCNIGPWQSPHAVWQQWAARKAAAREARS